MGAVLALALLGGAVLVTVKQRGAHAEQAEAEAHLSAEKAATSVKQALADEAGQVAKRATRGANLPAFSAIMGINIDETDDDARKQLVNTIVDTLEHESYWAPYRDLGMTAFFIGGQPVHVKGPAELKEMLSGLVRTAETDGADAKVLAQLGQTWLVGAGVVPQASPRQQRGVLVLLQPLTAEALAKLSPEPGAAVAVLTDGAKAPLLAGDAAAQGLLKGFLAKGNPKGEACCAVVEAAPGVEVVVARDATTFLADKAAEDLRGRYPLYAVSVFLVGLALFFAFRPKPKDDSASQELLKQTAAELQASREEMRRLSQRLSDPGFQGPANTRDTSRVGGDGGEDDLGDTRASVATSRYTVISPLGEGGMAKVSLAEVKGAEGFRRVFVLKRLRGELAGNTELVNQFIDEARLGASLVHSNIVPVFDFGRDTDGYYLAQEYILGRDVDYLVQASMDKRHKPLEPGVVLYLAQEALKALAYAHTRADDSGRPLGLVHRDVSPNNLMVSARGEVKLLDFGIVKSEQRLTKTQTGVVKGNLFYMSPEQAKGLPVDPRADLFSLGQVLFFAATGMTLYSGATTYELMSRAGNALTDLDVQKVRALGEPLASLLLKAMATDPNARYASADEFAGAVAAAGGAATSAELQRLMEELLSDELAAEQGRLSKGA